MSNLIRNQNFIKNIHNFIHKLNYSKLPKPIEIKKSNIRSAEPKAGSALLEILR